jgi:hypothetical protein
MRFSSGVMDTFSFKLSDDDMLRQVTISEDAVCSCSPSVREGFGKDPGG